MHPARNTDVEGAAKSIKQVEDRFNKKFRYPYVFLNEQPFDENFKKYGRLYVSGCVYAESYTDACRS